MMAANLTPGFASLSIEAQLDIVKNAGVYEKRVNAIKEAEEAAKSEREKLTKAKDLDTALKQAKQLEEVAREALHQARTQSAAAINHANERAKAVIAEAEDKARQVVASANHSITETLHQISEKQAEVKDLSNQVGRLTQQIDALTEKYNALVVDVRAKEAEKQNLLSVIVDKQRKLKALMVE